MNQPDLVGNPEELTNAWFTQVLHANNYDASVKGFTVDRVGIGQVARCYRFELDVEGDKNAPRSMNWQRCMPPPGMANPWMAVRG